MKIQTTIPCPECGTMLDCSKLYTTVRDIFFSVVTKEMEKEMKNEK